MTSLLLAALWVASLVGFLWSCSYLKRNDGSGRNRLAELHHFYWGTLAALLALALGWGWLVLLGVLVAAEDAGVHAYQRRVAKELGRVYPPDWEIGLIHRAAHKLHLI
jgi:hypothetical protein